LYKSDSYAATIAKRKPSFYKDLATTLLFCIFDITKNQFAMPNTYTQMYVQIVFAVLGRSNVIIEKHREELEKYICGIISNKKCKPLSIFCNPDHTHILIGLHPTISVSDLTRDIKSSSSSFINTNKWIAGKFAWQDGFGSFTYSKSQIDAVAKYILNQAVHHRRTTFRDEYLKILQKNDIEYDERYLFEWYD
jgi:REP element-mobilizing transposase RayT